MDVRGLANNNDGGGGGLGLVPPEEEALQDRKKAVVAESQAQKETTAADDNDGRKSKKKKRKKKETTQEHLLLREAADNARMWENSMYAKHTEGQAGKILDRVFQYMRDSEFPTELFPNWTEDLMEEEKTGWSIFKAYREMLDKYPQQNMEQRYCDDTDEWVWRD